MIHFSCSVDPDISDAVTQKFPLQCTALQDRQVSLAFFSDLVDDDQKAAMAARLLSFDKPILEPVLPEDPDLNGTQLCDFIGPQSWFLFQLVDYGTDWLGKNPTEWNDDPQYAAIKAVVRSWPGVNDFSERACRLAEDFKVSTCIL